jgi:peroxiredoxin
VNRIGINKIATLALLVVSLYLYGCSPSASPQTKTNVLVLQPETQTEAVPESIEEAAPQAKLAPQESPVDSIEAPAQDEPAQPESGWGSGGGAAETESFAQVDPEPTQESIPEEPAPAPTEESIPEEAAPAPQVEQSGSTTEPTVGSQAPEFNLQTLDGQSLQLSALRGKNVLLSYWVTWCIPCMEELPVLNQMSQEYQAQNLVILSVNGIKQDEMDKVMTAIADLGIAMPIAFDQDDALWNSYWVRFLPTSFFIDEDGVIRHIQLGSLPEQDLRNKIDQLISDQL